MDRPRNPRSDSAAAAVQAAQNAAQGPLSPPGHVPLPDEARPFWDALVRNRPRHRWNDADLATAALLAVSQWQVLALMTDAEQQPLVDKLGRRIALLSKLLRVDAESTIGRQQGKTLELEREAEGNVHPLIRRA
jgi:hypothetical protein